jgi:hypothetical protein
MGARFRLKSSFNISSFSPTTQVVLKAFQHFGLVLADNGADWFFGGTTDDWWGTAAGSQVVSELKTIAASQFDAIDESGLQAATGSYRASSSSSACGTPALIATPAPPQQSGTQVTLTATTSGCPNPLYEFWARWQGSSTWQLLQGYSNSNVYRWNSAGAAAGTEQFGIWVKDVGSATSTFDANSSIPYSVTTATCASVAVTAAPTSPQRSGTQVTITGNASGCTNSQYAFWARWQGSSVWQLLRGYSSTSTYVWNSTGAAAGTEYFGVWVKDASSSTSSFDANASIPYSVTTPACASVTISAAPTSVTRGSGTHVTITGAASGCPNANPRYEFWMRAASQSTWQLIQGYGTSATYDWNSTGAPAGTVYFGVWAKDTASPTGTFDANTSTPVTVT